MKQSKVNLVPKHGHWYARWKSSHEKYRNKKGKLVSKAYFESTGVAVPPSDATPEIQQQAYDLAHKVGCYLKELRSPNPPPIALQQAKLKEFALESARLSEDSLRKFAPIWILHYATTPNRSGQLPTCAAVHKMAASWDDVLTGLGKDADLHPSLIPTARLQTVVDNLPTQQKRNAINLRAGFKYAVEAGVILEGHDPATRVKVRAHKVASHISYRQASIQRGLCYMEGIQNGDRWQLLTVSGVYLPARLATICQLRIRPPDFERPEKPRKCAVLDINAWTVEYWDTKAKKWFTEELASTYIEWLERYIKKYMLGPGDYLFPEFARLAHGPSERWQKIMEASGAKMVYSGRRCLTGFHSIRVSSDRWFKENEVIALTPQEIANAGRHGFKVHQTYYDSDTVNIAQQRKMNEAKPKFLPGKSDLNVLLFEIQEKKREQMLALEATARREEEIRRQLASQKST